MKWLIVCIAALGIGCAQKGEVMEKQQTALVTGASSGIGKALVGELNSFTHPFKRLLEC